MNDENRDNVHALRKLIDYRNELEKENAVLKAQNKELRELAHQIVKAADEDGHWIPNEIYNAARALLKGTS